MTKLQGITIDPDSASDLDDALWCKPNKSGWDVWVFVAVPSLSPLLSVGSRLDDFAKNLVVTRYGGLRRSLLTHSIENKYSLTPYEPKQALVIQFKVSKKGKITYPKISLGTLLSMQRFSYQEAESILEGSVTSPFKPILDDLSKVATILKEIRNGLEGWREDVSLDGDSNAKRVVAELMIRANCIVAQYCLLNTLPVPYRVHSLKREVQPGEGYSHLLNRAWYQVNPHQHVGLGVELYCHATSPLRRYPDIVLHRQVIAHLKGRSLPYSGEEVQEICEGCNRVLNDLADQSNEFFKERDLTRALELLGRGHVHDLSKEQFSRLIKAAIRYDLQIPNLHILFNEIADRAKQLDDKDRMRVLFQLRFPDLQRIIMEATELYSLNQYFSSTAHSTGLIEDSGVEMIEHDQYFWCSAWIRLGAETYYASWQGFPSKIWAKRYAILAWFREWIDNSLSLEPIEPPDTSSKAEPIEENQTAVSALNNHAQKNRLKLPAYDPAKMVGPSHSPRFEILCKYIGFTAVGSGLTKREAKQDAAARVLAEMRKPAMIKPDIEILDKVI